GRSAPARPPLGCRSARCSPRSTGRPTSKRRSSRCAPPSKAPSNEADPMTRVRPATADETRSDVAPPRRRGSGLSERALARVFVAPSLILMALVALFPVLYAVVLSLFEYTRRERQGFAGLGNYVAALSDDRFWSARWFTVVFTVTSVAAEFVIGLGFALLMNQTFRGRGITRAAILIPWVIPTVIAAQMWFFMFNVTPGFINSVFGLGDFNWLGDRKGVGEGRR